MKKTEVLLSRNTPFIIISVIIYIDHCIMTAPSVVKAIAMTKDLVIEGTITCGMRSCYQAIYLSSTRTCPYARSEVRPVGSMRCARCELIRPIGASEGAYAVYIMPSGNDLAFPGLICKRCSDEAFAAAEPWTVRLARYTSPATDPVAAADHVDHDCKSFVDFVAGVLNETQGPRDDSCVVRALRADLRALLFERVWLHAVRLKRNSKVGWFVLGALKEHGVVLGGAMREAIREAM